jgi:hypothetical protein
MRKAIAPIRRRLIRQRRINMHDHDTTTLRGAGRRVLLPAIAVVALFATMPAAQADQQATTAQIDNALNWQAARGTGASGAYAQAPDRERAYPRHHVYR